MTEGSSLTGLSDGAAREFHSLYVKSFLGFHRRSGSSTPSGVVLETLVLGLT
jgi:hypothetical protein